MPSRRASAPDAATPISAPHFLCCIARLGKLTIEHTGRSRHRRSSLGTDPVTV
jgi:hypothetical protein